MTAFGQTMEPLDLAKKIFGKEPFPNIEKYIAGEYDGRPNGQDLQSGSVTHFLLLGQTSNKAVVAMTILDSAGKGLDTYLHFEKDSIWKMHAFRALAMTGIIEQAKNELEKMTPKQVDDLIEKSKKAKDKKHIVFASREDYNYELGNARLILELDENIIQHFLQNKAEFERIKEAALKEAGNKKSDGERSVKLVENLRNDYRKLFISSVSYGGYELGGKCLDFSIGGMLDNTVGFLYVKDKKELPEMNDSRVIMLREIGDGWYLYKTT
jgi:phosphopantetheine adenylyltransferase